MSYLLALALNCLVLIKENWVFLSTGCQENPSIGIICFVLSKSTFSIITSCNCITNVEISCEHILLVFAAGFQTTFFHLQTMDSINLDVLHSQAKKKRVSPDLQFLSQCVHIKSASIICGLPEKSTLFFPSVEASVLHSHVFV